MYQELGVWVTLIEILRQQHFLARDGKWKFAFRISYFLSHTSENVTAELDNFRLNSILFQYKSIVT